MYAKLYGATLHGIDGCIITVEVDISQGLPVFDIVGLPNQSVKEARERVRAAIKNSGYDFPMRRIVVNLAPATIRKSSAGLDLAIALGVLIASGQIKGRKANISASLNRCLFMGELALDGSLLPTFGTLAMSLAGLEANYSTIYTSVENGNNLKAIPNLTIYGESSLQNIITVLEDQGKSISTSKKVKIEKNLVEHINDGKIRGHNNSELQINNRKLQINYNGELQIQCENQNEILTDTMDNKNNNTTYDVDFGDVQGQELGKRAMLISAAGHHHCIMIGPPGGGKTMMAERLPTILPPMTWNEMVEVSRIQDVIGLLGDKGLVKTRPFRHPHHTATLASMVGGGIQGRPGEVTLAHGGVLFMDEAPEFQRQVIDALRQPLESRTININRSQGNYMYPANFICILAANPCPCGYYHDPHRECICSETMVKNYQQRLSGPIMDRIDLHIPVERPTLEQLLDNSTSTMTSESMRQQVILATALQQKRYEGFDFNSNGAVPHKAISELCNITDKAWSVLGNIFDHFHLSGRAFDRILKVARTIADLEENPKVEPHHISEAMLFRTGK
ncbi:MAG: YifB family Mg chelatase-like AAA ATPase [Veillonella sp.]|uniref:YifB family Mg chelatase-like AAA ATPase n=1 Tax=Veillonella TaxID=29465 RepID=UPI00257B4289|nr:YifB family Mg chelatase-like AAA ATPase [Veillonella sp.]MBS6862484.1 YifB family Mg chelatase-like AAA ATPase [Veillonella sp.]MDU7878827.1 YifB family Mg chelatase-like AAA ATPase [Veillonella sp.]